MPGPVTGARHWDEKLASYYFAGCVDPWRLIRDTYRFRPGPVRTQDDMTDEEVAAIEAQYGCEVQRRHRYVG